MYIDYITELDNLSRVFCEKFFAQLREVSLGVCIGGGQAASARLDDGDSRHLFFCDGIINTTINDVSARIFVCFKFEVNGCFLVEVRRIVPLVNRVEDGKEQCLFARVFEFFFKELVLVDDRHCVALRFGILA